MYLSADTFDDLLRRVIGKLLKSTLHVTPTKGPAADLNGVLLQLTNPRARLSLTERRGVIFGCLGEFLWYLSRRNSLRFITYYLPEYESASDDGRTVHGGYGRRLFSTRGHNQVGNTLALLKKHPDSRRAAIQLFDAADIASAHADIPCTCTMQFLIRRRRLDMFTFMRSNDVYKGLPHDIFAFTMLQELMARSLDVELGTYKHAVGSLHLYDEDRERAKEYLSEGWQERVVMPAMPVGDPWPSVRSVMRAERAIRTGQAFDLATLRVAPYWSDLVRLLQIFRCFRDRVPRAISLLRKQMSSRTYDVFIEQKKRKASERITRGKPEQLSLPGATSYSTLESR
jgi:thymidylate synthase